MLDIIFLGAIFLGSTSSNSSNKIPFEKALEKIKKLDGHEIKNKGKLIVKSNKNANIYFEKTFESGTRTYHISYFANQDTQPKSQTKLINGSVPMGQEFSEFLKNNKLKTIGSSSDLEKYIKLLETFCNKIGSLSTI